MSASTRRKAKSSPSSQARHTRKALFTLDTNVSSYDRTDPFSALNALRKLLVSLPARLGGCQFKITPEEHKLSMHLLTIVEPFVGLSQSRRTITRQPTELLDEIVFHLDSKRDLLSLALSCKRMHSVIFPRHYDYRVIRAKVSSIGLWNHLIVNRSLARNVRVLEIVDERFNGSLALPSDVATTDTDMESSDDELGLHAKQERYLVSALAKMSCLDAFVWSCNHTPMSIEQIWPTLMKAQSLQTVDIKDNLLFAGTEDDGSTSKKRQAVLRNLRTITLAATKHAFGSTKTPSLTRVTGMLNNCPNLENLTIGYSQRRGADYLNPVIDDLLLCGRWPRLHSLSLSNLWSTPHAGIDITASFLAAHRNLQVLHLDISAGAATHLRLMLSPDSLPHLRELHSNREVATAIMQCPCVPGRPLETIKGIRLSGSGWDNRFLDALKMHQRAGSSVRRVELVGWNEMDDLKRFVDCLPRVTWLDIGKRANGGSSLELCEGSGAQLAGSGRNASSIHPRVVEWATLLSPLSELTTFHGVRFFYEVNSTGPSGPITTSERSRLRKNEEIASLLAWKCPKLRRLDHWEEASMKVVVLIRDGEKVRYEVRRTKV